MSDARALGGGGHNAPRAFASHLLRQPRDADARDMTSHETPDDRYTLCLHLRSGDVQRTPYRSYAEARYAADLVTAAARHGTASPPQTDVPFLYVFPPQGDVADVEIIEG